MVSQIITRVSTFIDYDLRSRHVLFVLLGLVLLFGIFFANTLHESYPDEYDNITGGWFITHGILPYSGFFTHHGPVAYFVAAVIALFSGASFVKFRILYSIVLCLYFLGTYLFFRKRFGGRDTNFYLVVIGIIGFAATYFWGHMLLADSLAAFFLAPVFILLFLTTFHNKPLKISDTAIISVLTALAVLSSLTYIYVAILIYLYSGYKVLAENKFRIFRVDVLIHVVIFVAPYFVFVLYLLLTGSLRDYVDQAITFNRKYYIYNYPGKAEVSLNPIRYAIFIAYTFFYNFTALLVQVKDFNFNFPYNITLAIANVGMIIYLLLRRKFMYALFLFAILIFVNARSNPLDSKETDYQSAVYMVLSFINLSYLLIALYKELQNTLTYNKKLIYTVLILFLSAYSIFSAIFILNKFFHKTYTKYMGLEPLIYDRPELAPMFNAIHEPGYYVWVGPFEFKDWLYIKGKMPSKYHILLPGMARSPEIREEILADFEENKPEALWFNKRTAILGSAVNDYSGFFQEFLAKYYTTLYEYRSTGEVYLSVEPIHLQKDIETMLYIRKDKAPEIIDKLLKHNYIKRSEVL